MPLSEYDTKEALRAATDWLVASELPGSAAAREGIADTIPLVMMGTVEPDDLDDLAAIVEEHGRAVHDAATPEDVQRAQLREAVKAAFDYVRLLRRMLRDEASRTAALSVTSYQGRRPCSRRRRTCLRVPDRRHFDRLRIGHLARRVALDAIAPGWLHPSLSRWAADCERLRGELATTFEWS